MGQNLRVQKPGLLDHLICACEQHRRGAAASWPLAARAQQAARVPRIGWIAIGTPQGSEFFEAVRQGLRQLGYVEGQSVIIEPRWTADIGDRVPELVRELLALNVQVIVAQGAIVPLVRRVIESTPVVFGYSGDPVEAGLVNSFSRPGGNFTGATFMSYELNAKRVELLREAFPHVKRLAILSNPLHPGEPSELKESEKGAKRLGIELSYAQMRSVAEIEPALERIREAGAEGMIVLPDGLVMLHRRKIIEFAALQRIPVISGWSEFARSGGTMTYGPNLKAVFQRLAIYVDKILKGANPGELAVEQPTKFELVINLEAANALGLEVPVAKLWRKVCGVTHLVISAICAAAWQARVSCRVVRGLIGSWPGNSQPCGRAMRYQSRRSFSSAGDNIAWRSLRPLPCSTRSIMRLESTSDILSETTSETRSPANLLEQKNDIRVIQVLLGHAKLDTTALYTHVATNTIREIISPLDRLTPLMPKKDKKDEAKEEPKHEPPA